MATLEKTRLRSEQIKPKIGSRISMRSHRRANSGERNASFSAIGPPMTTAITIGQPETRPLLMPARK